LSPLPPHSRKWLVYSTDSIQFEYFLVNASQAFSDKTQEILDRVKKSEGKEQGWSILEWSALPLHFRKRLHNLRTLFRANICYLCLTNFQPIHSKC
jgi:hypothetical protein